MGAARQPCETEVCVSVFLQQRHPCCNYTKRGRDKPQPAGDSRGTPSLVDGQAGRTHGWVGFGLPSRRVSGSQRLRRRSAAHAPSPAAGSAAEAWLAAIQTPLPSAGEKEQAGEPLVRPTGKTVSVKLARYPAGRSAGWL